MSLDAIPPIPIDLYIPHGSDETGTQQISELVVLIFISHTVQMKPGGRDAIWIYLEDFISHTVQMKRVCKSVAKGEVCYLYIPHGSDET